MNQLAIDNAYQLAPDLWAIKDIFSVEEFDNVRRRIQEEKIWTPVDLQEQFSRESCAWTEGGLCDWLWTEISQLDFANFGLKFRTVTIWKDHSGYFISNHSDNDRVTAAMQIYISEHRPGLGTWFNNTVEIPLIPNTGYLMHNRNFLTHGMKHPVPSQYVRVSMYAWFDQII